MSPGCVISDDFSISHVLPENESSSPSSAAVEAMLVVLIVVGFAVPALPPTGEIAEKSIIAAATKSTAAEAISSLLSRCILPLESAPFAILLNILLASRRFREPYAGEITVFFPSLATLFHDVFVPLTYAIAADIVMRLIRCEYQKPCITETSESFLSSWSM